MISQTAEYAIRAMSLLACSREAPITAKELAELAQIPVDYLSKILQTLVKEGLVKAQRGPKGGFKLAYDPGEINLLMIIDIIDPIKRITSCPLKHPLHKNKLCPLHKKLDQAFEHLQEAFQKCSLADLSDPQQALKPLCHSDSPCKKA